MIFLGTLGAAAAVYPAFRLMDWLDRHDASFGTTVLCLAAYLGALLQLVSTLVDLTQ